MGGFRIHGSLRHLGRFFIDALWQPLARGLWNAFFGRNPVRDRRHFSVRFGDRSGAWRLVDRFGRAISCADRVDGPLLHSYLWVFDPGDQAHQGKTADSREIARYRLQVACSESLVSNHNLSQPIVYKYIFLNYDPLFRCRKREIRCGGRVFVKGF